MAKVSLRAYNREIETMLDRSHLDEAVAHCQHILKTFPKHLETYRLLGKAYLEARRHDEAMDIFSRVLAAEPNDFVAHVGMSIIRDEQKKLDEAIWHMERAFEVQSANPAIQGELQRLYGRREGSQPPRIRMTRGALAHMYMRGELYPQAISETKGVLEEDPERSDMQVLLARAYYRSGQKNDAADAASAVLKRYPYCYDANLVLAEILGDDRLESAQVYRRRVIELDPYAGQAVDDMFRAGEVSDAAVSIEHLDWNGQPVGMPQDWSATAAINMESESQPEWMRTPAADETPPSVPAFDPEPEAASTPAQSEEDIPNFLRAAGWGASTGAFDESQSSMFKDEPATTLEPISEGDLPEWVKAMAPQEIAQPADEKEEEMPDWINKIGTDDLPVPSTGASADEGADWLKDLTQDEQPAVQPADGEADWMKDFDAGLESTPATDSSSDTEFLQELKSGMQETSAHLPESPIETEGLGTSEQERDDSFAWLEALAAKQGATEGLLTTPEERLEEEPDWVRQAKGLSEPAGQPVTDMSAVTSDFMSEAEAENVDASAMLDMPAAEESVTEGLPAGPEAHLEQPDEIVEDTQPTRVHRPPVEEAAPVEPEPVSALEEQAPIEEIAISESESSSQSTAESSDELGKSEAERDDSFAWLESLAARQGATEGLLTTPEERLEEEPEWVRRLKNAGNALEPAPEPVSQIEHTPVIEEMAPVEPEPVSAFEEQPPVEEVPEVTSEPDSEPAPSSQPMAGSGEELGKSEDERDDSFAWLEALAARQGATEGLLTTPEERLEEEPEWVRQAKDLDKKEIPVQPVAEEPVLAESEPEAEAGLVESVLADDSLSGLQESVVEEAVEETISAPVAEDETTAWLKSLDEAEEQPVTADSADDLPGWLQSIGGEEVPATEPDVPTEEAEAIEESGEVDVTVAESSSSAPEELPAWLSTLAEEEVTPSIPASDDLPAWMRDETGEVVAEPTKIEPTRTTDWTPVEEVKDESSQTPPPAPAPVPAHAETVSEPELEPAPEPKPKKPAPKKEKAKPASPPEPYREPVTIRGTGMLNMPVDPILDSARNELSRSNIPGALDLYGKLIKKGRFLEEVIFDLREALYRYPVEVSIWQALGDAYMRANQLQDALDAYTKAEELLR